MPLRDLGMSAGTEWRAVEMQLRDLDMDKSCKGLNVYDAVCRCCCGTWA